MRAKDFWKKLPDVDVNREHLKMFWTFVAERQAIWYRRFILRNPPPWTKDPILRDFKFTNVYRELDYGTIWYMKKVIRFARRSVKQGPQKDGKPFYDKRLNILWCTVLYRLINRVETFEEVGFIPYFEWSSGWRKWRDKFERRQRHGLQIFTNAHLTLPTHTPGQSKLDKYFEVLQDFHDEKLIPVMNEILDAKKLEDVFKALRRIKCVGRFIAYEVCCDLILAGIIPFTENDWVNPGPGCQRGINLIFPRVKTIKDYQLSIKTLCLHQDSHFEDYDLKFHRFEHHPLTLRGIEHSLCEFQKYFKMKHKVGKQRMYFKPRDWGQKLIEFRSAS